MENFQDKALLLIKMVQYILANSPKVNLMDKELIQVRMEKNMLESGNIM